MIFVLTKESTSWKSFILMPMVRDYVSLKMGTRGFLNSSPFKRLGCFTWQSLGIFNVFQRSSGKLNFFLKDGVTKGKSITHESATVPYKTCL